MTAEDNAILFEESSGNVFSDIGFDQAVAERLAYKAGLVGELYRRQQTLGLTQTEFSKLTGIPQPRLSNLFGGRIAGMSTDKLLEALSRTGSRITIHVRDSAEQGAGGVALELA